MYDFKSVVKIAEVGKNHCIMYEPVEQELKTIKSYETEKYYFVSKSNDKDTFKEMLEATCVDYDEKKDRLELGISLQLPIQYFCSNCRIYLEDYDLDFDDAPYALDNQYTSELHPYNTDDSYRNINFYISNFKHNYPILYKKLSSANEDSKLRIRFWIAIMIIKDE